MRIIVDIEQVLLESDQTWERGAEALSAAAAIEFARLIAQRGTSPDFAARVPGVLAAGQASSTGRKGDPIPRQLASALDRVLGGVR